MVMYSTYDDFSKEVVVRLSESDLHNNLNIILSNIMAIADGQCFHEWRETGERRPILDYGGGYDNEIQCIRCNNKKWI